DAEGLPNFARVTFDAEDFSAVQAAVTKIQRGGFDAVELIAVREARRQLQRLSAEQMGIAETVKFEDTQEQRRAALRGRASEVDRAWLCTVKAALGKASERDLRGERPKDRRDRRREPREPREPRELRRAREGVQLMERSYKHRARER
ncbi:unnamed protein product, partial [Effrenium voratum]